MRGREWAWNPYPPDQDFKVRFIQNQHGLQVTIQAAESWNFYSFKFYGLVIVCYVLRFSRNFYFVVFWLSLFERGRLAFQYKMSVWFAKTPDVNFGCKRNFACIVHLQKLLRVLHVIVHLRICKFCVYCTFAETTNVQKSRHKENDNRWQWTENCGKKSEIPILELRLEREKSLVEAGKPATKSAKMNPQTVLQIAQFLCFNIFFNWKFDGLKLSSVLCWNCIDFFNKPSITTPFSKSN